jgi:FkbM family methyltransferase
MNRQLRIKMKETVRWLIKGPEAVTIFDKCMLLVVKIVYLGLRTSLRITLGKERRDRLCIKHDVDFGTLWYKFFKILKYGNEPLLKLNMPKYDFQFYCRNNKEDFKTMVMREDEIIHHFDTKQGDIVVDVGAHIGKYTLIASKRVGENGKVIAIEAHPGNYEMLNRNIKLNGLTNVIPLNYAVYSKETKIKLFLPGKKPNQTIYNTLISSRATDEEKFIEVNANTLDNLLQKNGISHAEVNWIKIDVEGAELEVLKGAYDIMSNSKNITLLIEIHNLQDGKNLYSPIMNLMEKHNFKVEFENTWPNGEKHIILHKQVHIL